MTGRRLISNKFIEIDRTVADRGRPVIWKGGWIQKPGSLCGEIVDQLDTSEIEGAYKGGGSAPYPPKMMLVLLFYCYAKGIFASRQIEKATYELIPVLYITGGTHTDHDSINKFRKRFLAQYNPCLYRYWNMPAVWGYLSWGTSASMAPKSRPMPVNKAMSWEYANKLEVQLLAEVSALLHKSQTEAGGEGGT